MQLLVSVRSGVEAAAACAGGADIVDAKEPDAGALGAVTLETFRAIRTLVPPRIAVSAAAGDVHDEPAAAAAVGAFASAGAAFVKIGFAGVHDPAQIGRAIRACAASLARPATLVAVAYADADRVGSMAPAALIDVAAWSGARGVLLDTAIKSGAGVRDLMSARALAAWVRAARGAGLLTAIAGRLTAPDLPFLDDIGAHIAGVRGAACDGGRTGTINAERVRHLRWRIAHGDESGAPPAARAVPVASRDV